MNLRKSGMGWKFNLSDIFYPVRYSDLTLSVSDNRYRGVILNNKHLYKEYKNNFGFRLVRRAYD